MTSIRPGNKLKKINIPLPELDPFIHKVYIHVGRKIYKGCYVYEVFDKLTIKTQLQIQRNKRDLETFVQEGILNAIRESIPVDPILKAYLEESTEEEEVVAEEHVKPEKTEKEIHDEIVSSLPPVSTKSNTLETTPAFAPSPTPAPVSTPAPTPAPVSTPAPTPVAQESKSYESIHLDEPLESMDELFIDDSMTTESFKIKNLGKETPPPFEDLLDDLEVEII